LIKNNKNILEFYMSFNSRLITLLIPTLLATTTGCDGTHPFKNGGINRPDNKADVVFLDQGWTDDDRQAFYYLSQGSELLPYHWFLALEQSDNDGLFRSDENMKKLGYIPQKADKNLNPDGLPIGFVKNENPAAISFNIKKEFLGASYNQDKYPVTDTWLGQTCSNCHTSQINYNGHLIRIDGGSSHADHEGFLTQLVESLKATTSNPDKMSRFARRVLDPNWNQGEQDALKERVIAYTQVLDDLVKLNKGSVPYGHGRLDAFGAILNRICATNLDIPGNKRPSNAPVSYPFLWTTPQLDWVQYNSSAGNPLARNVGEVMGVYAHLKLTGTPATGQFDSTVNIQNLDRLEGYVEKLQAPAWPAEHLGKIDPVKAEMGKQLYAQDCMQCHHIRDAAGNFPMTPKNQFGKQFVTTVSAKTLQEIGTDPQMIQNILAYKANPGALRDYLEPKEVQTQEEVSRVLILKAAVKGAIQRKLAETGLPEKELQELAFRLSGMRTPPLVDAPLSLVSTYKARPLNGIWATAPFLHNGSVPNLYQLLLPEDQRVKKFSVGTNEFDPVQVGYKTDGKKGFEFDTTLKGNWNTGHSGPGYTQTQNEDGTYRDYTDEERWALVEYMKTLI
jgi:hypothetical protein